MKIYVSQRSSVSMVNDYGLHDWGSILSTGKRIFILTATSRLALGPMGTGNPFPGSIAQLGYRTDRSFPSSAKVTNE
jgi:hypothetical protein